MRQRRAFECYGSDMQLAWWWPDLRGSNDGPTFDVRTEVNLRTSSCPLPGMSVLYQVDVDLSTQFLGCSCSKLKLKSLNSRFLSILHTWPVLTINAIHPSFKLNSTHSRGPQLLTGLTIEIIDDQVWWYTRPWSAPYLQALLLPFR